MKGEKEIQLANADACTGCRACVQSCAKGAISMREDREGFLQPHIDTKLCVGCHKCEQVCPIVSPITIPQDFETKAYAAINKDEAVRMRSSSGGMFHALAKWTIEHGGVVFGARFDDKWEVMHDYTETIEGIEPFMRSKYVQSRVGDTYKQAKEFLDESRWVLYSGTPCQIGGLHKFLGKDYDKLIMVDLICHGVPSPGVWRKYLKEFTQRDQILDINFRDKRDGWLGFQCVTTTTTTTTTTTRREQQMANSYFRGFLKNVYLRRSCYQCAFKTVHRISDITLADFWGVQDVYPVMFDDKGTSALLIHSSKGAKFISLVQSLQLSESLPIDSIIQNNVSAIKSVLLKQHARHRFFFLWKTLPFRFAERRAEKDILIRRIIRRLRKMIWKS